MLILLFKLKRKLEFLVYDIVCRFRIYQWRYLYSRRIIIGQNFKFGKFFSLIFEISPTSASFLRLGSDILMRENIHIRIGELGKLSIGDHCFFNHGCNITCFGETTIGNNCQFGESVKFYDHNHHYKAKDKVIKEQGYSIGTIRVGNNCWIGSNVVFLKDVEIGDNVIIGAGCIIYQSVPSNTVVINRQDQLLKSF